METVTPRLSWTHTIEVGYESLPPDLIPTIYSPDVACWARDRGGYVCTRLKDHSGRHAAGDGVKTVAVW